MINHATDMDKRGSGEFGTDTANHDRQMANAAGRKLLVAYLTILFRTIFIGYSP
ncbi:MAG: hypothetical protein Q7U91_02680 [Sideroxyarcus sp.]|nr:hypothetical protein [Sideroxyarcus sp.]